MGINNMLKVKNNIILKYSVMFLFAGIITFLCFRVGFAQTTQIFRTYKTDVSGKIPESSDAVAAGKKLY